jgi:hypothetical protein
MSPNMLRQPPRGCRSKARTRPLRSRLAITVSGALIRRNVVGYSDFKIVWMCSAACLPWRVPGVGTRIRGVIPWNLRRSFGVGSPQRSNSR